ncbi:multidrug efflux protein [Endozoicomonas sp. OPT23]|uniref:efflux RND transporter permease subunit n=1 Tax=Endozoicomonas sp. OPT23 TaxID=2072845 RepID=UPI00129B67E0|nr:efflux RND transporter permease subunit [Endozoicomonas sp. OPT23]MRI31913.1 multidrug efflux protein [Endozoicomonas sp. OPT23]
MKFTDHFIRRPVLATVISFLIILLGLQAWQKLQVRQFPKTDDTVVTVTTVYPGASARLIQGFITTPLQQRIASAEGIEYISSRSNQGSSVIEVHIERGFNSSSALSEIMAKVNEARTVLPAEAESPVITKGTFSPALMYIRVQSDTQSIEQMTDYLDRAVQPRLATLPGVGSIGIDGAKTYSMRVWLDPLKMTAFNVTAQDVRSALASNNFLAAAGSTKSEWTVIDVNAATDISSAEDFARLIIRSDQDKGVVRLGDVAKTELSAANPNNFTGYKGEESLYLTVKAAPGANPIDVIDNVLEVLPEIQAQQPVGMIITVAYDATDFIRSSIDEVVRTLGEATLIVVLVVFLFLGSFRIVLIPVITIPLSLIGALFFMMAMGYSINLLTLLALVLAIGLVVDDAIVVVENVHRHIEAGLKPFQAAIVGAREIASPVISMTITLAAVYAPIGFVGGLTGALFQEFAFTLAGAVIISGVIALTLSPMMASKMIRHTSSGGLAAKLDKLFDRFSRLYGRALSDMLKYRSVTILTMVVIILSLPALYMLSGKELAPQEDKGIIFGVSEAPRYSNLDYMNKYTSAYEGFFESFPEYSHSFIINDPGSSIFGMLLKPWDQRERGLADIQQQLQNQYMSQVTGLNVFTFAGSSLPGAGSGLPVQFILTSTNSYQDLNDISGQLVQEAMKSGLFMFAKSDLRFDKPEIQVNINRKLAGELGVSMQDIANTLATMLGSSEVNRFSLDGRSYKVIPQAAQEFRMTQEWLGRYQVRTISGDMVSLATLVSIEQGVQPNSLTQFQQLNSAKIQGMLIPGTSMGQALEFLQTKAKELAPNGYSFDYEGESRQFIKEGNALGLIMLFAIIVIFLVLAAQFESFRDPLVILFSVPLSLFGAMVPIALGYATLNIYTQIGLVTLVGLITKHGILIVEFANQLRDENPELTRLEAVQQAATIRLRPVLMTTAAMVLGVLPLLSASGAGAASRYSIGLVIASGMSIGTLFTLFVVPVLYTFLSKAERQPLPAITNS